MHIFRRRAAKEAEVRQAESLEAGLAALPASSRPVGVATRNRLRAVATEIVDRADETRMEMQPCVSWTDSKRRVW